MYPYVKDSIDKTNLKNIIVDTLSFPTPVVHLNNNIFVLELFHGPTKAFKDALAGTDAKRRGFFLVERA